MVSPYIYNQRANRNPFDFDTNFSSQDPNNKVKDLRRIPGVDPPNLHLYFILYYSLLLVPP